MSAGAEEHGPARKGDEGPADECKKGPWGPADAAKNRPAEILAVWGLPDQVKKGPQMMAKRGHRGPTGKSLWVHVKKCPQVQVKRVHQGPGDASENMPQV